MASVAWEAFGDDAERRLAAFGLKSAFFLDALRGGEADRRLATPNEPANSPGTRDYIGRVRTLRELLIANVGWRRFDRNQIPLVASPDKLMAIGVLLGDSRTGLLGKPYPKSKRPTGTAKIEIVSRNFVQGELFPVTTVVSDNSQDDEQESQMVTWFLISCRRVTKGQAVVRSEFSLASNVDGEGHVDDYLDRIILPELRFESLRPPPPDESDGGVDVPVEER
jgi:hypothetical protein